MKPRQPRHEVSLRTLDTSVHGGGLRALVAVTSVARYIAEVDRFITVPDLYKEVSEMRPGG